MVGMCMFGQVINIIDYGVFVELEDGVEGLIYVFEMSWIKKNVYLGKIVLIFQEVFVEVFDVDFEKCWILFGFKQIQDNLWLVFMVEYLVGIDIEGEVCGIIEFGLFVGFGLDFDGMVYINDIFWEQFGEEVIQGYQKGDIVMVCVFDVDIEKECILFGIK